MDNYVQLTLQDLSFKEQQKLSDLDTARQPYLEKELATRKAKFD